jgi:hypothetical protein
MGVVERVFLVVENNVYEFQWDKAGCKECPLRDPKGPCDGALSKQSEMAKYCLKVRDNIQEGNTTWWSWKRLG